MRPGWAKLLQALREPRTTAAFGADDWDSVVRQALSAGLLARLAATARDCGIDEAVPVEVRRHMTAVSTLAAQQQRAVRWELVQLTDALAEVEGPILLLKGAAYAAADLPPASGRLFSDIDLLVPKAQIGAVEADLMLAGWNSMLRSAYDQRYYRQWMHEIPPMVHIRRQTVIDLHHNILPETARLHTSAEPIIARSRPLTEFPRFHVPSPVDLVLHSATHLFHEGEWGHGLRDLVDLDAMLRTFGARPGFWDELLGTAGEMGLGRPVFYALRYCERLLSTPMPEGTAERCPGRPSAFGATLMDAVFVPAFSSAHHSCRLAGTRAATFALYVRSHWLRMPLHLLLPHLVRKAWMENVAPHFDAQRRSDEDAAHGARLP